MLSGLLLVSSSLFNAAAMSPPDSTNMSIGSVKAFSVSQRGSPTFASFCALHVVLDGLFLVAGLLTGGGVGEHTVDGALEGVAHDVPHRVGAGLSVVEALDELSALAAVDDEARLHDELKPLLSGLAVRAHVLVECDVVERGVLQAERLLLQSGVGGLLSALRAVEGAGVCRIAVDGPSVRSASCRGRRCVPDCRRWWSW